MDEFIAALKEQLEYMVDADTNGVYSFKEIDEPGEHAFVAVTEDGREYRIEIEEVA